jgi:hypothetical protein
MKKKKQNKTGKQLWSQNYFEPIKKNCVKLVKKGFKIMKKRHGEETEKQFELLWPSS